MRHDEVFLVDLVSHDDELYGPVCVLGEFVDPALQADERVLVIHRKNEHSAADAFEVHRDNVSIYFLAGGVPELILDADAVLDTVHDRDSGANRRSGAIRELPEFCAIYQRGLPDAGIADENDAR